VVLAIGAALGVVCLTSLAAMAVLEVHPLVVRSGSMSPTMPTGSLALAAEVPATSVHPGEVVSVLTDSGVRVTHRVVRVEPIDEHVLLTLQGDANDAPDPRSYAVDEVLRVRLHAPALGYAVGAVSGPVGRALGGALAGALVATAIWPPRAEPSGGRPRHRPKHLAAPPPRQPVLRRPALAGVVVLLLLAGTTGDVATARSAGAAWGDGSTANVGAFTAYTVPAPAGVTCNVTGSALSGFTAHLQWPAVTSPYALGYTAVIVDNGTNLTVATSGANRVVTIGSGLLGSLLGTTITVRLRANLPTTPAWTSAATDQRLAVGLLGLSLTCV
jgi:signal peptidase I